MVPAGVWDYTLGGYQVIKKWLSYREGPLLGRDLKPEEIMAVAETARRIGAILLLQPELDGNYRAVKGPAHPLDARPSTQASCEVQPYGPRPRHR
jgi:hypothetical protein